MTTKQLYQELNQVDHSREKRLKYAHMVLAEPQLIPKLLEILFIVDDTISCRAAWVFECISINEITSILPHLEQFTTSLSRIYLDPAVRPVSKVCELLAKALYNDNPEVRKALLPIYQDRMIEACFDWLINDEKVAPKAYAMTALFHFGRDYDWIHTELKTIIERDYQIQSSGFKTRARMILNAIVKLDSKT